jgi:hypothetical protein
MGTFRDGLVETTECDQVVRVERMGRGTARIEIQRPLDFQLGDAPDIHVAPFELFRSHVGQRAEEGASDRGGGLSRRQRRRPGRVHSG